MRLERVALTPIQFFQILPSNTDPKPLLSDRQFEAVSRWALDLLPRQYEARKAAMTADF